MVGTVADPPYFGLPAGKIALEVPESDCVHMGEPDKEVYRRVSEAHGNRHYESSGLASHAPSDSRYPSR